MTAQNEILNCRHYTPLACLFLNLMLLHIEKLYTCCCREHKILSTRAENLKKKILRL